MIWGICALLLIIILIMSIIIYIIDIKSKENFLSLDESLLQNSYNKTVNDPLNMQNPNYNKPAEIQYQIPIPVNQLTDKELQSIDTDVLRYIRNLANFSMTDELDFYQIYSLIKTYKTNKYSFTYKVLPDDKKSKIKSSEQLIAINSGAINTTDLDLFSRLKLELISSFNSLILKNNAYLSYHPFHFFKIINSNMISNKIINTNTINTNTKNTNTNNNSYNFIFTLTFAREYKYQQFVIYYDVDLISTTPSTTPSTTTSTNTINYNINLNKVELIGIPIPKTVEFRANQKTDYKPSSSDSIINDADKDYYYKDQVSENTTIDISQSSEPSSRFNKPNLKYIDITETNDMDNSMFDINSLSTKIHDRIMNVSRDKQYNNHRCYGLVNGVSKELPQYKNPIFCKSFHPEINQNGIWDSPCQVNSDCPFYKANKNYSNEYGKCDKVSGKCEMPMGIISIGFTKFGKLEPNCYNCGANTEDSKCCGYQADSIKTGIVNYKSPDYIFKDDEPTRKEFENDLKSVGLLVNPSI